MSKHVLSVSASINAPPETVYGVIADYRRGHPQILPEPPFESLVVEEGGLGEGTILRVGMRMMGRSQVFRARVTEPEPGRTLVEHNDTGYTTTFTVEPDRDGERSRVEISTVMRGGRGIAGALERLLVARLLRPVYERELELLGEVARDWQPGAPS